MKSKTIRFIVLTGLIAFSSSAFAGFDWEGADEYPPKPTWFQWFGFQFSPKPTRFRQLAPFVNPVGLCQH